MELQVQLDYMQIKKLTINAPSIYAFPGTTLIFGRCCFPQRNVITVLAIGTFPRRIFIWLLRWDTPPKNRGFKLDCKLTNVNQWNDSPQEEHERYFSDSYTFLKHRGQLALNNNFVWWEERGSLTNGLIKFQLTAFTSVEAKSEIAENDWQRTNPFCHSM